MTSVVAGSFAHEAVGPSELWSAWHPDLLVVAGLAVLAIAYRQGLASRRPARPGGPPPGPEGAEASTWAPGGGAPAERREGDRPRTREDNGLRPRSRPPVASPGQVGAFVAGLAVVAVALVSPLDGAAGALFSAHMIQHLLLIVVAAPLLVAGRAGRVVTLALPRGIRRRVLRVVAQRPVRRVADVAWHPLVVWGLGTVVLWGWHLPVPYEAALRHDALHAVEHLTLLGTALLGWTVVVGQGRRRVDVPIAVLLLFGTALQGAALGAVLVFARTPLYPIHEHTAPLWHLTPLEDQQLAGGLMWVPPGLIYLGVTAALVVRWFNALDLATWHRNGGRTTVSVPSSDPEPEAAS